MTQVSRNQPAEVVVSGLTSPPASSVSVNGVPATVYPDGAYALGDVAQSTSDTEQTVVVEATSPSGESVRVSEKYSLGFPLTGYSSSSPLSMTCTTDAAGNLSRAGDRWFQYDGAKQLIAVWEAGRFKTEYQYDGLNRVRVRKRFSSIRNQWKLEEERRYLYDGMQIVQERDGANQTVVSYTRGLDLSGSLAGAGGIGGLLAFSDHQGPGVRHAHYHSDGNGNITAMMNRHGRLVAKYHYDPFGNLQGQAGPLAAANPYRFSSKQYQANTGMYSYGFRFYEPSLQRWINQDPVGEIGGLNVYAFVQNDPTTWVDPSGNTPLFTGVIGGGIGAVIGGGSAWLNGGSWNDIGRGALRGGLAGGVAGLTLGFGGAAIAGSVGGGALGGALAGGVAAGAGNLASQAFDNSTGYRCGYSLPELARSALFGAATGGIFLRPYTAPSQPVTSWAPGGVAPNLDPGRWAMVGGASARNYLGTVGPALRGYPIGNSISGVFPGINLVYPGGLTGNLAGLIGQRIFKLY